MLVLETLGALQLTGPDGVVLAGRRKELALLAYIARHEGRVLSRAALATLLWGERDETRARHSLSQALAQLRRVLGDDRLELRADQVVLRAGVVALDIVRFEAELAAGRAEEAVALWKGEFLAAAEDSGGESFRLWVEGERAALRTRLTAAFDALVERAEQRGEWRAAAALAERWAAALPWDEHAQLHLLQAMRLAGRTEEARAHYAAFGARLREELAREPSPELERLGRQLDRRAVVERHEAARASSAALYAPEFVGRGPQFAELAAAWRAVERGALAVVLVEGEEGIGKTRLCQELLRWITAHAAEPPCVISTRGSAGDDDGSSAVGALLAPLAEARGLAGAPPEALAALSTLVPAVRAAFPTLPEAVPDPASLPARIARVIADVAAEAPVVIDVDDLPRAAAEAQRLVAALAHQLSGARVLLLASARVGDEDAAGVLAALRALRITRRIKVPPLARADVHLMLASMVSVAPQESAALADRLFEESGGNPRYIAELVAALADEGRLVLQPGDAYWRLAPGAAGLPLPLPKVVCDAVGRRLARLSPRARSLLADACTLGRLEESAAAGDADAGDADALGELLASQLLRPAPPPERGFVVSSPLLGRAVRRLLLAPPARRRRSGAGGVLLAAAAVLAAALALSPSLFGRHTPPPAAAVRGSVPAPPPVHASARAYDLFLRARYLDNRPGVSNLRRAIGYYQQAIASDSSYAGAYAGLAGAYLTLLEWGEAYSAAAVPARAFAERAIRLDPSLAEAHAVLARLHRYDWRWAEAEREFAYAIAAAPADPQTRHARSHLLMALGRVRESLEESERALALDPVNPRIAMHLCWHHYEAHEYDAALVACRNGLELDPTFPDSHSKLAWVYLALGRLDEALAEVEREITISDSVPQYVAQLAVVHARAGRPARARALLRGVRRRATDEASQPQVTIAIAELALGEVGNAFATLEHAYARRNAELTLLPSDPAFVRVRGDPRYRSLLRRLGLPEPAPAVQQRTGASPP